MLNGYVPRHKPTALDSPGQPWTALQGLDQSSIPIKVGTRYARPSTPLTGLMHLRGRASTAPPRVAPRPLARSHYGCKPLPVLLEVSGHDNDRNACMGFLWLLAGCFAGG